MTDPARIRALLAGPAYARIFREVRARVEASGVEAARSVTLKALTEDEADALAGLLGVPDLPRTRCRLELSRVDAALRASECRAGLVEVLTALGGPLEDRRRARADQRDRLERLWSEARAHPVVADRPVLAGWLDELKRLGLFTRAAARVDVAPEALLEQALGVVAELPAREEVLLPVLAGRLTGDTHGLDAGRPLAGLVLRAAAHLAGRGTGAAERRELWAEMGVLCDALSSQVLVLGLRPLGAGRLARTLRDAAEAGEAVRVTLRELSTAGLAWPTGGQVFVCENPAVTAAAADALGAACAPLVCTEGVPSLAAQRLLAAVAGAGAVLRFQADFDWPGLRIARVVAEGDSVRRPWRLTARDYAEHAGQGSVPLRGEAVPAPWDPELTAAMAEAGMAVYEEQLIDALLSDLERAGNRESLGGPCEPRP